MQMDYRKLGRSGLKVSLIGLGCNVLGGRVNQEGAHALIGAALDAGINFFDVADIYGGPGGVSETILGKAIADRRDEVILATKGGFSTVNMKKMGTSRRYLIGALEASLKRLNTDYVDLYQIHSPDPDTPVDETLRALEDMMRDGKIRYYGASNLAAWQAVDAGWTARTLNLSGYISVQNEYNLLTRGNDGELLPALDTAGMGLIPYFPLASGLLTGKYRAGKDVPEGSRLLGATGFSGKFMTQANLDTVERLAVFVEVRGRTLTELAFAWLASKPQVSSIIASATSLEQLRQNAAAADWKMTAEEVAEVEALALPA
jgi:aryl-alcohol dehydrogenase-like predicted oxidoreductase